MRRVDPQRFVAIFNEVEEKASTYKIDLSDALQLVTILRGPNSILSPHSASVLITADAGLADATKTEKIRVWNCNKDPWPSWTEDPL